ncbi:MAG: PEP-CTERM sorting domain-containing protein [Geobacteraceae bacterium]|nr:PEP-CTERM sorting domain-containing protein [Geobacteraceae bacterium]
MKKILITLAAVLAFSVNAIAATINFDTTATGTYTSLSFSDLTITYTGGTGSFQVSSADPGSPISGNALLSYYTNPGTAPFLVTFNNNTNVNSFSIGVGDYNQDVDNTYLQAFDASWNLLGSDYYQNPDTQYGGDFLSVATASAIKYVKFWDADPYPGAVYWDVMSYDNNAPAVPEPSTMLLLGGGLAGLAFWRRKQRK